MFQRFSFSRHGDCDLCGGTGTIERYRHIKGGYCYTCHGTGGKRPPEGTYKVYGFCKEYKSHETWYDYYGTVTKVGRKWTSSRTGTQQFKSRREAAQALKEKVDALRA